MNSSPGPRVLLVEDDPLAAWTERRLLERLGCRVSEADCCRAATQAWKSNRFDLIVVDQRLPDGLGVELIADLRAAGRRDPVICLTAESEAISEGDRETLHIRAVLGKPIDIELLRATVAGAAEVWTGELPQAAEPHKPTDGRQKIGRFEVLPCPLLLTRPVVENYLPNSGDPWLALDLTHTTQIEDEALDYLLSLAASVQRRGGRLCLAGVGERLGVRLGEKGLQRQVDILADLESLESLSRTPVSPCERAALMDSIVE